MTDTAPAFPKAPLDRSWTVSAAPAADFVYVTPEVASMWLELNNVNRRKQSRTIEQYQLDMSNGDWFLTGEPIQFDWNGDLLNGQHRLIGIARNGEALLMLIVRGLAPQAQEYMDKGKARSAAQALDLLGFEDTSSLGALSLQMLRCEEVINGKPYNGFTPVSWAQQKRWVLQNPDAPAVVKNWGTKRRSRPAMVNQTAWTTVALILLRKHEGDGSRFLEGMASGADLPTGSPVLAARNTLNKLNQTVRNREKFAQIALLLHAWELWLAGTSVSHLKWDERPDVDKVRRLLRRNYVKPS